MYAGNEIGAGLGSPCTDWILNMDKNFVYHLMSLEIQCLISNVKVILNKSWYLKWMQNK